MRFCISCLLLVFVLAQTSLAQDTGSRDTTPGITPEVDRILQERDAGGVNTAMVSRRKAEEADALRQRAQEVRESLSDQTWIVLALDSLRRSQVVDSQAHFDRMEQALIGMQSALDLTEGKYPAEMSAEELGRLRETVRNQVAEKLLESMDYLEAALKANPWDEQVLETLAGTLEDLGRIYTSLEYRERAAEVARQRITLDPGNYFAWWDLADVTRDMKQSDKALELYTRTSETLKAWSWLEQETDPGRLTGRQRDHLVYLCRERVNLAMKLGNEEAFRAALADWEPVALGGERKEIGELKRWLNRAGGSLGLALQQDRAWQLIQQGRELEARELLQATIQESTDQVFVAENTLALADLEFYRLEMRELGLERVTSLAQNARSLPDSLRSRINDTRATMTLNHAGSIEADDPLAAWELYTAAAAHDNRYLPLLSVRIADLLANRPEEALQWLERALENCDTDHECTSEDQLAIYTSLTQAYRRLGRAQDARDAYERVQELRR